MIVTVIYYDNSSLELHHRTLDVECKTSGRVIIPEQFRKGKSIIAVCEGEVDVLNKVGDRILPVSACA
ncbi:TIGR02922 family protein [Thalassotalea mangrovi]|uniref:TIGR02922 family protein n=1 Tax=Thalassotalea mangrovi TaxID=2572245 RepID=A0A4V5NUL4_9GAMM|nr:TIGR02922 family protein [Thalassotalea mangrovi]TKB46904.1 TIGR02922 family protein [Thalassotalea mangrovi]